jgi:hypothetical protein
MSIYEGGEARYWAKRKAGISEFRRDGSKHSPDTDKQAAAAEKYAADLMGCKFNSEITTTTGDGGFDFLFELGVEVYWPENPRAKYLIVSKDEPHRWADLYVVVRGTIEAGFEVIGWTYHGLLLQEPVKNFGYGERYCMPLDKLFSIDRLMKLKKSKVAA